MTIKKLSTVLLLLTLIVSATAFTDSDKSKKKLPKQLSWEYFFYTGPLPGTYSDYSNPLNYRLPNPGEEFPCYGSTYLCAIWAEPTLILPYGYKPNFSIEGGLEGLLFQLNMFAQTGYESSRIFLKELD